MVEYFVGGPAAPKDPEKKRPYFYIMRGTTITGSPQPDGTGIQFLYQDCGRLESSAKIVGSVENEEILELMSTVAGLRKLVHSIGIRIEAKDPSEVIRFAFQMYGKTDPNYSGTTIEAAVTANGAEKVIHLDEIMWSEDDNVPGQIRFHFTKPETFCDVSIALYLQDGYEAPVPEEDFQVDFANPVYDLMLEKSIMKVGNPNRIKRAIKKARDGEDVTIAYIGGSITQGAGAIPIHTNCYAYKSFQGFCKLVNRGCDENVHFIKAGVGGTPSELGLLRYERDVLRGGSVTPDIVIVEFAVNDEGDETKGECYDSLVRKIFDGPGEPAVILLFSVFANDWNLQERLSPVGRAYDLPMVSIKDAVVEQFYKKIGEGKLMNKSHFFFDSYHPTNLGHKVMADCLCYLFQYVDKLDLEEEPLALVNYKAPIGGCFSKVKLLDRMEQPDEIWISEGGFQNKDDDIQAVEMDLSLEQTKILPHNWMHTKESGDAPFEMELTCCTLFIICKDSGYTDFGIAEVLVDGEVIMEINPQEVGWTHSHPIICFREKNRRTYHIQVRMKAGEEDKKFTILGWAYK